MAARLAPLLFDVRITDESNGEVILQLGSVDPKTRRRIEASRVTIGTFERRSTSTEETDNFLLTSRQVGAEVIHFGLGRVAAQAQAGINGMPTQELLAQLHDYKIPETGRQPEMATAALEFQRRL